MALSKSETDATLLKVIVFPNTTQLPLYVGDALGIFARHGLTVERTITPTSTFQITKLAAGEFDIAIGAFDNIVAYQEGQGAELLQDRLLHDLRATANGGGPASPAAPRDCWVCASPS